MSAGALRARPVQGLRGWASRPGASICCPRFRAASTVAPTANASDPAPVPTPAMPRAPEPIKPDPQLDLLGYPRLPSISRQWRSPYAKYDDQQDRSNFNEVLHAEDEMLGMFAPDVHKQTASFALKRIAVAVSLVASIIVMAYIWQPERPTAPRAFPYGGLSRELGGFPGLDEAQVDQGGDDDE